MNEKVKRKENDFELVYSTSKKLTKDQIKSIRESKEKQLKERQIVRK